MIRVEQLLVALGLAFVPYLVAVWVAPRLDWRRARGWIIGVALAARLVCLPLPFVLSDDVYRYLWEGQVQNAGFNPYRSAPDAPELARLRDNQVGHVSHPEVPTIYPPWLLLVFRGAAAVSSAPAVFKYIFAGFDLLTLWVLVGWLRARGQNESLFDLLVWLLRDETARQMAGGVWLSYERTKLVCAAALAGVFGWVWWRRSEPPRAALTVAGALLLLSSTVHPWYVTWLVALSAAEFRWSWLAWSATVLLAYGSDGLPAWRWLEYLPVFAALTWEWSRANIQWCWAQGELKL